MYKALLLFALLVSVSGHKMEASCGYSTSQPTLLAVSSNLRQNGTVSNFQWVLPRPLYNVRCMKLVQAFIPYPTDLSDSAGFLVDIKEVPVQAVTSCSEFNAQGTFIIPITVSILPLGSFVQKIQFDYAVSFSQLSFVLKDTRGAEATTSYPWWIILELGY
jgi:hypothetical protein